MRADGWRARGNGRPATPVPCDLSDRSALGRLAESAWDVAGRIDALFLNAGIAGRKQAGEDGYEAEVAMVFAVRPGAR